MSVRTAFWLAPLGMGSFGWVALPSESPQSVMMMSPEKGLLTRRRFMKACGAMAVAGAGTGLYTWRWEPHWVESGHTHGGQCKPPFLPPPILPVRNRRYQAGEYALEGNRRLYINRGLGHLLRVRFNVRPEVTVFRLEHAD